jgi:stearoyl-CoA desaturase (delta-9 desaturase)
MSSVPVLSEHDRKLQQLYRLIGVPFHHAAALLAFLPYFFTWTGVASAVLGYLLIALLGINIGYHRLLAHRGISCSKGVERVLAALGVLNVQFGPAYWVAIHRRHHHLTDVPGDPHSPRAGFLKSHLFFLFPLSDDTDPVRLTNHYAKDLLADPFYAWFEKRERWFLSTILPGRSISWQAMELAWRAVIPIRRGWAGASWCGACSSASSWFGT